MARILKIIGKGFWVERRITEFQMIMQTRISKRNKMRTGKRCLAGTISSTK